MKIFVIHQIADFPARGHDEDNHVGCASHNGDALTESFDPEDDCGEWTSSYVLW